MKCNTIRFFMCFSSIASFTSAGGLWIIGFGGLWINYYCDYYLSSWNGISDERLQKQIRYESRYWWPILLTPIFFGIQQFCEGFVWIYLNQDVSAQVPGFCFSFFAFCFWPVWVPFICLIVSLYNPSLNFRYILTTFFLCGFGLFLYMILSLSINGQSISTSDGHVIYKLSLLSPTPYGVTVPYLLCTIFPFLFIPKVRLSWLFSLTVGGSAVASYLIYQQSFPSTWCYFSAWLSLQAVSLRLYDIKKYHFKDIDTGDDEDEDEDKRTKNHKNNDTKKKENKNSVEQQQQQQQGSGDVVSVVEGGGDFLNKI